MLVHVFEPIDAIVRFEALVLDGLLDFSLLPAVVPDWLLMTELKLFDWSLFFERRFDDRRLLRGVRRMEDLNEPWSKERNKKNKTKFI